MPGQNNPKDFDETIVEINHEHEIGQPWQHSEEPLRINLLQDINELKPIPRSSSFTPQSLSNFDRKCAVPNLI